MQGFHPRGAKVAPGPSHAGPPQKPSWELGTGWPGTSAAPGEQPAWGSRLGTAYPDTGQRSHWYQVPTAARGGCWWPAAPLQGAATPLPWSGSSGENDMGRLLLAEVAARRSVSETASGSSSSASHVGSCRGTCPLAGPCWVLHCRHTGLSLNVPQATAGHTVPVHTACLGRAGRTTPVRTARPDTWCLYTHGARHSQAHNTGTHSPNRYIVPVHTAQPGTARAATATPRHKQGRQAPGHRGPLYAICLRSHTPGSASACWCSPVPSADRGDLHTSNPAAKPHGVSPRNP